MKKWLGQNFLKNFYILQFIAEKACENNPSKILEIGAGDGRLSILLGKKCREVYAVEYDKELCEKLAEKFKNSNIYLVCGDFLELKPFEVDSVVGNIPYYISSEIIFSLKNWNFKKAVLMVQKEFAEKMVAKPNEKNYGRLSVTSQLCFDIRLLRKVSAKNFFPKPKVDSAVIELKKKNFEINEKIENFIRTIFSQKNKKVKNSFKNCPEKFADKRPRTLSIQDIIEIYETAEKEK